MPYRAVSIIIILLLPAACSSAGEDPVPPPAAPGEEEPGAPTPPIEDPPLPPRSELDVAITSAAVGCLRIGATPAEVRADCAAARDTTIELEGMRQEALAVAVGGADALAEIVEGRVWRITVAEPGPATDDGLQVGTPASRLAVLDGARVNTGEGRYFVTVPEHCGLSFGLEGVRFDASPPTVEELRASPDTVRVSEILVLGDC